LKEQHFQEGSDIKSGQLLFVIEDDSFRAKRDSAEAQLAEAKAALAKAKNSKAPEIATSQLALDTAQMALNKVEESRQRTLLQRNAASREDVDRADANRKKAEAQVDADRASLEQSKADYDVNIQSAEASVASATAALKEAEINLSYCRIFSQIDGRIGQALVKVGNLVGPSAGSEYTELATVKQLDPMGVAFQVSSAYLEVATQLIRDGFAVRIRRPGFQGEQNHPDPGKAFFIDNTIDPSTSTFLMKAEVPNPRKSLLPGEYVQAEATLGSLPDAVVVPEQAVLQTQAGSIVLVVDKDSRIATARVQAAEAQDGIRVIESGLDAGQKVVVEGLQLARPGMKVQTELAPDSMWPNGNGSHSPGGASGAPSRNGQASLKTESPTPDTPSKK
jgi:RND family efflux transporter MFP subunit